MALKCQRSLSQGGPRGAWPLGHASASSTTRGLRVPSAAEVTEEARPQRPTVPLLAHLHSCPTAEGTVLGVKGFRQEVFISGTKAGQPVPKPGQEDGALHFNQQKEGPGSQKPSPGCITTGSEPWAGEARQGPPCPHAALTWGTRMSVPGEGVHAASMREWAESHPQPCQPALCPRLHTDDLPLGRLQQPGVQPERPGWQQPLPLFTKNRKEWE